MRLRWRVTDDLSCKLYHRICDAIQMSVLLWQEVIVDGDTYMEFIEMGGRTAREQLRMKLPTFGAAPAPRRTDSLLNEVKPFSNM